MSDGEPGYPQRWEADVVLRDGTTAHVRPITPDDDERLRAFHGSLSPQTVYYRFFAPYPTLTQRDVDRFTRVDHDDRVALVATVHDEIVGVTRYDRLPARPDEAEVAFTVRDAFQGRGLGSVLLEHLAAAARERGVRRFVAEVLPDNARMLSVFRDAGYAATSSLDDGYYTLEFPIAPTQDSIAVMETREHRSEARSVAELLAPSSVVVLGAGHRASSAGRVVLRHLDAAGFTGPVHVVNPRAAAAGDTVAGHVPYARVGDIGEPVALAVLAVPAADVPAAVADCATAGVRGLVVVSAGFAESGPDGRVLQSDLVAAAHANGMRVLGPNCLGLINTDPKVRLNASLSPVVPSPGRIGFFSQSGALGVALLQRVVARGLGLSTFVSAGNRADISGNDLLQYWEDDRTTDIVLLYLESIGNPRKFSRIARRTSTTKPIVAVKSGRSSQGIPLGHTVRRSALPAAAVDAMFAQSGVIQVDTLSELFDVAVLLASQPLPAGRRVAVIGNSDALAVLAADACADRGLEVVGEPSAVGPRTDVAAFGRMFTAILDDPAVDAVLALFLPSVGSTSRGITRELARLAADAAKPVLATVLAVDGTPSLLEHGRGDGVAGPRAVPAYGTVEDAVHALAAVCAYVEWKQSPHDPPPELDGIDAAAARALVEAALERTPSGGPLSADEVSGLLACYGVQVWPSVPVADEDAAVRAATTTGYPVVLKTTVHALEHRGDLGAVRLDLADERAVRRAYAALADDFGAEVAATAVVQRMAGTGVPCVVRTVEDLLFGPVVSFGVGGIVTELVDDRAYRIPPLARHDAAALVRGPRAAPLLFGHRGAPPADAAALEDLVLRIGRLAYDLPEIAALELNPVLAQASGAAVLAATAVCAPPAPRRDGPARRLS